MTAIRSISMLNAKGDQTICWTEESDDAMLEIIKKKLDEGVAFYIVEPRGWGLLPPKKTRLERASDALKGRALTIEDADFAAFVGAGNGEVATAPAGTVKTVKRSKDAKEIASSESVGVKQRRGG